MSLYNKFHFCWLVLGYSGPIKLFRFFMTAIFKHINFAVISNPNCGLSLSHDQHLS